MPYTLKISRILSKEEYDFYFLIFIKRMRKNGIYYTARPEILAKKIVHNGIIPESKIIDYGLEAILRIVESGDIKVLDKSSNSVSMHILGELLKKGYQNHIIICEHVLKNTWINNKE